MCRQSFPRVYELIDLIADRSGPSAYFQNFNDSIRTEPFKHKVWLAREQELQRLDSQSWSILKSEARPYLTSRHASRGWEQLFSILNQARAYNYLLDNGCQPIQFIPKAIENGIETPDLKGVLSGKKILCEVKTVNISDMEAERRNSSAIGTSSDILAIGFFNKLTGDLIKSKSQMGSYDNSIDCAHLAFIVLNFDDFLAEYKESYFRQIDQYLASALPVSDLEIILYNQRTAFHSQIVMKNAVVINELG